MRPDKTKAEQRWEEKVIVTAGEGRGGGARLCARRLCNVWHRFRVFAIFHSDKREEKLRPTRAEAKQTTTQRHVLFHREEDQI